MSDELGTYSFLPWLRHGIANNILSDDLDSSVKLRAAIQVELGITGRAVGDGDDLVANVSRDVALYGPGDIVGIDQKAIVKNEPRHWITNFEPNYLPYIEFYDEDFPWRYTPAAPDTGKHRLRPWLMLVVVKETEFKEGANVNGSPLPTFSLEVDPVTVFPPAEQLWAWAHVHINKDMIKDDAQVSSTDMDTVIPQFESMIKNNPDHAYSRIVCPRKLDANTSYHAFLIPTFESGRLAGLGQEQGLENPAFFATLSAWSQYEDRPQSSIYPFYFRWYFKTGTVGDFEHLVRLLKPRPPDSRLGRRDMDVQRPGSNISGIVDEELDGVLRLGGALKVPDEALTAKEEEEAEKYEQWDNAPYPHGFQSELAAFINLSEDYAETDPVNANSNADALGEEIRNDPDPLITPPLYARWHALTDRLLFESDGSNVPQNENWVHEMNLDPRWRVAAGFGTSVIQDKQEDFMDAAWGQVGDIIEANRKLRQAQLAKAVSWIWYDSHLKPLHAKTMERGLVLMRPLQRRVLSGGVTVHHAIEQSNIPRAILSPAARRMVRPRDHISAKLGFDSVDGTVNMLTRINNKEVSAAPEKVTGKNVPTIEDTAAKMRPDNISTAIQDWLKDNPWAKYAVLVITIVLALLLFFLLPGAGFVLGALSIAAGIGAYTYLNRLESSIREADAILPEDQSPETIDNLPKYPDFKIAEFGTIVEPTRGDTDSGDAQRFKTALKDVHLIMAASAQLGEIPQKITLDLPALSAATFAAINPEKTIPEFTLAGLVFPAHIIGLIGETFKEAMAYPKFDTPMYQPLLDISTEHFLPNIKYIKQNTITLLETNQRFIEAYMVGLNHEFARELLWREFPTDQRGSYFRQFWDVSGVVNSENLSEEELTEKLKDIPPLHLWSRFSSLGDHDHREVGGDNEEEVVLVIRGELLKKYPTAVIYAHRAKWQVNDDGEIDPKQERILDTSGDMDVKIKPPLYEAKVEPDIFFLGFDLTAEEAKGGTGRGSNTDPGWFFVIKERPGEPRFGLDISRDGPLNVWNDLAWPDVLGDGDNGFIQITGATPTKVLQDPVAPELQEKRAQYEEDKGLRWHANTNAAELAYILYQVPVLVAVHGSEMLPH